MVSLSFLSSFLPSFLICFWLLPSFLWNHCLQVYSRACDYGACYTFRHMLLLMHHPYHTLFSYYLSPLSKTGNARYLLASLWLLGFFLWPSSELLFTNSCPFFGDSQCFLYIQLHPGDYNLANRGNPALGIQIILLCVLVEKHCPRL